MPEKRKTKRRSFVTDKNAPLDTDNLVSLWDRSLTAAMSRGGELMRQIEVRLGIDDSQVFTAFVGGGSEEKELVAEALRKELEKLRELETKPGTAPARLRKTISRAEISDAAMMMLSSELGENPELFQLFGELLNVDTHRRTRSEEPGPYFDAAAGLVAQYELDDKKLLNARLAEAFAVDRSTVTRWRRDPRFQKRVQEYKEFYSKPGLDGKVREKGTYYILRDI